MNIDRLQPYMNSIKGWIADRDHLRSLTLEEEEEVFKRLQVVVEDFPHEDSLRKEICREATKAVCEIHPDLELPSKEEQMVSIIAIDKTQEVLRKQVITYDHHGSWMKVRADLIGKHREHCLCFRCGKFNPGKPETNCKIANLLYAVCLAENVVTPVWECPKFVEEKEEPVEPTPPPIEEYDEGDVSPDPQGCSGEDCGCQQ